MHTPVCPRGFFPVKQNGGFQGEAAYRFFDDCLTTIFNTGPHTDVFCSCTDFTMQWSDYWSGKHSASAIQSVLQARHKSMQRTTNNKIKFSPYSQTELQQNNICAGLKLFITHWMLSDFSNPPAWEEKSYNLKKPFRWRQWQWWRWWDLCGQTSRPVIFLIAIKGRNACRSVNDISVLHF